MSRKVLLGGLAGALALVVWNAVVNIGFHFTARLAMTPVPNERAVHQLLKEQVRQPGAYMANPAPTARGEFPAGEPVFAIRYGGVGHEAAGRLMVIDLLIALASSTLAAGLLSVTSRPVLSSYGRSVLFVAAIGLVLAIAGDLPAYGIGGYPARDALLLAANRFMSWIVAGAAIALVMRERAQAGTSQ